ncbi:3-phenylpropionate/cinnamic acid dioxygenase ferredoxin--NAD(+) reductase subunit [Burkholderia sp. AU30198]|uniref:3-phenylpropionate/cinnamic acid dioxygenase ferredoxin--NAD(+) reductase subunit n=1 Tax=Burkholderia sp. AU30198 TaxID=2879627 RepID=UPI001CF47315|nr:3-phenylpropionate/cinnamic acid dioxygenase ferredoxin--NAD(+) reductase subunit [Burkholderia sp. AU30198]
MSLEASMSLDREAGGAAGEAACVIVGAGQAGTTAAAELRRRGFDGPVVLIGDEPHVPYERPPLSKEVLLKPDGACIALRPETFYADQRIERRLGTRVTAIDPAQRTLTFADGTLLEFGKLLLATGARVRRLPMLDRLGPGVHTLRTLDDAHALRRALQGGTRLLIVGGGVIGMEVASSAIELGARVTVIEQGPDVMARCAPLPVRSHLLALHRARGVDVWTGVKLLDAARNIDGFVLTLEDGTAVRGDVVVYGIGVEPDDALARDAGLCTDGGILVDSACRTSHPDIFAAGDNTAEVDPRGGPPLRRESWDNANRQAVRAASAMLGEPDDLPQMPWFWTDQCGVNLQFAGDMTASEWIERGDLSGSACVLFGLRDGVVTAGVTLNRGRDMRFVRTLIERRARLSVDVLSDCAQDLRALANNV